MEATIESTAAPTGSPASGTLTAARPADNAAECKVTPLSLERLQEAVLFATRLQKILLVSRAYLGVRANLTRPRVRPCNRPAARGSHLANLSGLVASPQ